MKRPNWSVKHPEWLEDTDGIMRIVGSDGVPRSLDEWRSHIAGLILIGEHSDEQSPPSTIEDLKDKQLTNMVINLAIDSITKNADKLFLDHYKRAIIHEHNLGQGSLDEIQNTINKTMIDMRKTAAYFTEAVIEAAIISSFTGSDIDESAYSDNLTDGFNRLARGFSKQRRKKQFVMDVGCALMNYTDQHKTFPKQASVLMECSDLDLTDSQTRRGLKWFHLDYICLGHKKG